MAVPFCTNPSPPNKPHCCCDSGFISFPNGPCVAFVGQYRPSKSFINCYSVWFKIVCFAIYFKTAWPLKMGLIDCPEVSVNNCQYALHNSPEERMLFLLLHLICLCGPQSFWDFVRNIPSCSLAVILTSSLSAFKYFLLWHVWYFIYVNSLHVIVTDCGWSLT